MHLCHLNHPSLYFVCVPSFEIAIDHQKVPRLSAPGGRKLQHETDANQFLCGHLSIDRHNCLSISPTVCIVCKQNFGREENHMHAAFQSFSERTELPQLPRSTCPQTQWKMRSPMFWHFLKPSYHSDAPLCHWFQENHHCHVIKLVFTTNATTLCCLIFSPERMLLIICRVPASLAAILHDSEVAFPRVFWCHYKWILSLLGHENINIQMIATIAAESFKCQQPNPNGSSQLQVLRSSSRSRAKAPWSAQRRWAFSKRGKRRRWDCHRHVFWGEVFWGFQYELQAGKIYSHNLQLFRV